MVNQTAYEHGARKLKEHSGPDPNDDFSQEAAENKKPPNGMGLTEASTEQRSEYDKSDFRGEGTGSPQEDARGQFETNHAGGSNNGMSSANPRVLSGDEDGDATFPLKRRPPDGDVAS
jgi:hypothetical protein